MEWGEGHPGISTSNDTPTKPPEYAGLIIRFFASLADSIAELIVLFIPALIFVSLIENLNGIARILITLLFILVVLVVTWLYHAYFESSGHMATPGKMLCGLKVTDLAGERITFGRATIRFFAKSAISVLLGFVSNCLSSIYNLADVFAMFTNDKRQCIHDMVAETVVIHA